MSGGRWLCNISWSQTRNKINSCYYRWNKLCDFFYFVQISIFFSAKWNGKIHLCGTLNAVHQMAKYCCKVCFQALYLSSILFAHFSCQSMVWPLIFIYRWNILINLDKNFACRIREFIMTHNEVKANFIITLWPFVEFANNDGRNIFQGETSKWNRWRSMLTSVCCVDCRMFENGFAPLRQYEKNI